MLLGNTGNKCNKRTYMVIETILIFKEFKGPWTCYTDIKRLD